MQGVLRLAGVDFNPRPRAGSDPIMMRAISSAIRISIHAPAQGATRLLPCFALLYRISIHAPAQGATRVFPRLKVAIDISIHAPAQGAT